MLHEAWRLSDSVSLRPEPFGALVYDFRTRKLSFLKSPALVRVVEALAVSPDVATALEAAGVGADQRERYLHALGQLARSAMITPVVPDQLPGDLPAPLPDNATAGATP